MTRIRIAGLIVMGLAPDIQAARPADLPLQPKHDLVIDRSRQHNIDRIEKEILFQQFLEWLKKRTDHDQGISLRLRARQESTAGG